MNVKEKKKLRTPEEISCCRMLFLFVRLAVKMGGRLAFFCLVLKIKYIQLLNNSVIEYDLGSLTEKQNSTS